MDDTSKETQYFFELTPERILEAVDRSGLRCTGRCLQLNSMENRVYEVEIEVDENLPLKSPSERFRVVKFYRPGRWSEEQIREEHQFLLELVEEEIPVVPPLRFSDGETLHQIPEIGIFYAVFPKQGGRSLDELSAEHAQRIGRLIARVHIVGSRKKAVHRMTLTPKTYGLENLALLKNSAVIPLELERQYLSLAEAICQRIEPLFDGVATHRLHGDCHLGNILWGSEGPFLVDFDDSLVGPPVQDLWLLIPGRDDYALRIQHAMVEAYEEIRNFDRTTLRLIEPLRALRLIHFNAWIARRWKDPAFSRVFPEFKSHRYWQEQLQDLEEQRRLIEQKH